ncbi:MAG: ribosome maturation factor RimM [Maricaulaceae bacterium]
MNTDQTKNSSVKGPKADMICVAAIAGAFGVKGEVKLKPFTQNPMDCLAYGPLMTGEGDVCLTPTHSKTAGKFIAVSASEVTSREMAEAMKSTKLYVSADNLPAPDEDEFYYRDLVGLQVKTVSGQNGGKIIAVHEYGAGDMIEIKPKDSKSYYHPFTKEAVPKVDIKAGRVVIVPQIAEVAHRSDEEE